MSKISILVPTRNRPQNVERLVGSAYRTASLPPEFVFYIDDDDPTRDRVIRYADNVGLRYVTGPRIVLSEMWNRCAERTYSDVLMHCGDDIVFQTPNWDVAVLEAFDRYPDKIALVHGDDGYQHDRLATHGFYHRAWIRTLGRLVPPYFSSDYNDLWNTEVADMIGRRVYLPNVVTEHMHPSAGKGELDQTHLERLERHRRDDVAALYASLAHERAADAGKLREVILAGRVPA